MGIFGFLKNNDTDSLNEGNLMTLEEALLLETEEDLLSEGLGILDIGWKQGHPVCETKRKVSVLTSCLSFDFSKKYKNQEINAASVFETAEQKGSGIAAFLLGVFHEHGIGGLAKDSEKAELHYSIAISRGCILPEVVSCAKTNPKISNDLAKTQEEILAAGMFAACAYDDKVGQKIRSLLSKELDNKEKAILLQISSYLVYYYAERDSAWFLFQAMLSSVYFKEFVKTEKLHKYYMVDGEDNGIDMNRRLYDLARLGNPYAIAVIQKMGIKQL